MAKIFEQDWDDNVTQVYSVINDDFTRVTDNITKKNRAGFIMNSPGKTFTLKHTGVLCLPWHEAPDGYPPVELSVLNGNFIIEGEGEDTVSRFGEGAGLALTLQNDATFSVSEKRSLLLNGGGSINAGLFDNATFSLTTMSSQSVIDGRYELNQQSHMHIQTDQGIKVNLNESIFTLNDQSELRICADGIIPQNKSGAFLVCIYGNQNSIVSFQSISGENNSDPFQLLNNDASYEGCINFSQNSTATLNIDVNARMGTALGLKLLNAKKLFTIDGKPTDVSDNLFDITYGHAIRGKTQVGVITIKKM
ncbi:hypothetical protein [Raoultella ornithinolytica]|uniref:hypothetical protein n=1 Tax=Raoultella ornithinolytica TaxID=54291 RepID=UPI0021B076FC|nr:hypothetical protein [Raoultella ornithinolytica]MCT4737203.1 hypothetical protein [Raoultella ornithinolytica]